MAKGLVRDTSLSDLANMIRRKLGTADTYLPSEMADAIKRIGLIGKPFGECTDEELVAVLALAHNGDIDLQTDYGWEAGDTRTIHIQAFTDQPEQDAEIMIYGFGDYASSGCVMQFDFKNELEYKYRDYNKDSTQTRNNFLPSLVTALPTWLQNSLVTFSGRKLELRSWEELQTGCYTTENESRKKRLGINGAYTGYMTRDTAGFYAVGVNSDGERCEWNPPNYMGVSPFGCL